MKRSWILGAYAASATLSDFNRQVADSFYRQLASLSCVGGLELPVHVDTKADDPWAHLDLLPKTWNYILSPLPALMQSLMRQSGFGLASIDEEGRVAALDLMKDICQRVARLQDHCGHQAVLAVELHSGPSLQGLANQKHEVALRRSLETLSRWDWHGAELWLEHCDAFIPSQTAAKGFLPLAMELPLVQEFSLGLNLNWARSVIEARNPDGILQHIEQAKSAAVLRGLFISGVTVDDPVYGSWLDNHAPMSHRGSSAWAPQASLLTEQRLRQSLQAALQANPWLGVKIQPAPAHLSCSERIACLESQLARMTEILDSL